MEDSEKAVDWLPEQLKSIKNLCETAIIIHGLERWELLPTLLEEIYCKAKDIVDERCVVREE